MELLHSYTNPSICRDVLMQNNADGDLAHPAHWLYIHFHFQCYFITMTSLWPRWCLKSSASRLFTQPFIRAQIKIKHQSPASLAFVWGIHRGPVNSPHKWPVTRKMFPFDDVIMLASHYYGVRDNIYNMVFPVPHTVWVISGYLI